MDDVKSSVQKNDKDIYELKNNINTINNRNGDINEERRNKYRNC